jgi:glycosyltransferase involved in cell wall biosynthesis
MPLKSAHTGAEDPTASVLLVAPAAKTGGIARFAELVLHSEIGSWFVLFDTSRPPKNSTKGSGVGYRLLFDAGLKRASVGIWTALASLIRFPIAVIRIRPGIVYLTVSSHWPFWEHSIYLLVAKLLNTKVVFHYLGALTQFWDGSSTLTRRVIKWVMSQADLVVVLSELTRQFLLRAGVPGPVRTLPSSVPAQFSLREDCVSRQDTEDGVRVLFLGGASGFRKGVRDLSRAIELFRTRGYDQRYHVRFVLCGGDQVWSVRKDLEKKGALGFTEFRGWISEQEKLDLYRHASIFVLPSYNEGMPYAIVEAMAAGLPIIATDVGSIPEVVEDSVNGYLTSPGDAAALVSALLRLANSPELRRQMGLSNIQKAAGEYSLDAVTRKLAIWLRWLMCEMEESLDSFESGYGSSR